MDAQSYRNSFKGTLCSERMYILGLNIGHNATACLLKDGTIVGCVSEERFSRIKNECGVPLKSIAYLLKDAQIASEQLDLVVCTHDELSPGGKAGFSDNFFKGYSHRTAFTRWRARMGCKFPQVFERYTAFKESARDTFRANNAARIRKNLPKMIGVSPEKVMLLPHHRAHALAPCFNLKQGEKTLVFTLDGEGLDGLCATVNIWDGRALKTLAKTPKSASLGYLYAIATIFLGMKPLEHEFKVMGLAPYAKKHKVDEVYEKFKGLITVDNSLVFKSRFNMPFADQFFEQELKFVRFDTVAAAVQRLTEELTSEWVQRAIKKTGIHNVALSGGVFMNVKANQCISALPEVKSLFVMPSAGDESNAMGACLYGYQLQCAATQKTFSPKPLTHLYLGPLYDDAYLERLIEKAQLRKKYVITQPRNLPQEIARLLAKGEIVARCSGRSEWGARSLGNRAILANPKHTDTIRVLNETIKDRDFWMPFTPSILDSDASRYLVNPRKMVAPYMVITFDSTPDAQKELPAAMHPYDFTLRPQVVTKEHNAEYHAILQAFKKLTGIGGVLNTSFNLHGEPNVLTPEDALHTVEHSSLKYVTMGSYLFEKK